MWEMVQFFDIPDSVLYEDGTVGDLFSYLCCVSAITGRALDKLRSGSASTTEAGRRVYYLSDPLIATGSQMNELSSLWYQVKTTAGVVGVGMYVAHYFFITGENTEIMPTLTNLTPSGVIVRLNIKFGQQIQRLRGDGQIGERSLRQNGSIIKSTSSLLSYWKQYRPVEENNEIGYMYVSHATENMLEESASALRGGRTPKRYYTTPAYNRAPNSNSFNTLDSRIHYKAMAYILLVDVHWLTSESEAINETDIMIDERGTLSVPISSPKCEEAFSSLWARVSDVWNRLGSIETSLPSVESVGVTVDGVMYYVRIE